MKSLADRIDGVFRFYLFWILWTMSFGTFETYCVFSNSRFLWFHILGMIIQWWLFVYFLKRYDDEQIIVYSVTGTWWDSIDNAGRTRDGMRGPGLPCCPKCGSMLYQTTKKEWWKQVREHNMKKPGYTEFVKWLRGKCYPSYSEAITFYRKEVDPNFMMR